MMGTRYLIWAIAAVAIWAALAYLARRMVFHPMPQGDQPYGIEDRLGVVDVWIPLAGGERLHAWWRPADNARLTTLFLHGNAGNLSHREDIAALLPAAGSSVLLLDYRGYGRSTGAPSVAGVVTDALAAYGWLRQRGVSADRLVLHGESLGTSVALQLAAQQPCAALVLEAPFTSLSDMAGTVLPFLGRTIIWGLDSRAAIAKLRVPVLLIHGTDDEIVPFRMGQELLERASPPKELFAVEGAHHNDLREVAGPEYVRRLSAFYRTFVR
jgi:fermentation-respiration switch protein FrsA (DUF1100 family)